MLLRLLIIIIIAVIGMSVHQSAVLKAKKILGCYDELEPRKYLVQPHLKSNEK